MKKLTVLQFICSTGFYGAERWILALAKHLDPRVFNSELAVTNEGQVTGNELASEFERLGFANCELPMTNRFDYSVVNRLARHLRDRNVDIIHTHGYKSDIIGCLAARKAGVRWVSTPHGFERTSEWKLRLFIWLGCMSMRFADRVVPLSPELMDDMKRFGVRARRLSYIQNGVDLSEVEAEREREPGHPEKRGKWIGFIGQLIQRKNVADTVSLFHDLAGRHPDLELVLLGDGEERGALEAQAAILDSRDRIRFLGFRDDRLRWLRQFDLFVMTSSLEGIPRCLMEATAMGVPVAAYDIPGVDQIIKHGKSGLLAKPGDLESLARHAETLLYDRAEADRIREGARQYVYQHYSAQRMADEYGCLFRELVESVE